MHFAAHPASRSNSTKLALVVVFHLILGYALVKSMGVKLLPLPAATVPFTLIPDAVPPITPPQPPAPKVPELAAPKIVVPVVELPLPTPAQPNTVTTTTTTVVTETTPPAQTAGTGVTPTATPGTGAGAIDTAAMINGCALPEYPKQSARNGDSGIVTLALLVGVDGRVTGSRVERSSGFRELDKAALTALSLCTFKPATQGGVAQSGWAQIAYEWKLD
jgi:protein TonB